MNEFPLLSSLIVEAIGDRSVIKQGEEPRHVDRGPAYKKPQYYGTVLKVNRDASGHKVLVVDVETRVGNQQVVVNAGGAFLQAGSYVLPYKDETGMVIYDILLNRSEYENAVGLVSHR